MKNKKLWIGIGIVFLMLFLLIGLIKSCQHENQNAKRVDNHDKLINQSLDNSTIEAQYRAQSDIREKLIRDSLKEERALRIAAEAQDTVIVNRYFKVPTLDNGKAVIASKDKVISSLKKESKTKDGVILEKDTQLESYDNENKQLKLTQAELDKEFQNLNAKYVKDTKPKNWNISLSAGYGIAPTETFKPVPFVGISIGKTIVRF
ncbi:hypothetical protein [Adhaeribacter arboris]|nr:hypothetical protein [Adhaeribacter arboris]